MSDIDLVARAAAAAAQATADAAVPATRSVNGHVLSGNITLVPGDIGLGNVTNTRDIDKPISTAVATALAGKCDTGDARLSDSRAPTGAAGGDLTGTFPNPTIAALAVTDAKVAVANKDGTAATPSMRTLGTSATQACAGNDSRLSDSRAPTAHASSHTTGADQIADVTTTVHGLARPPQYAEMYEYDNSNTLAIDTTNTYHALFNAALVAGKLNGWTFSAGASGSYTAIADLGVVGGANQVRVTTSGAHTLVAGQTINLTSSSVAGYLTQAATADHEDCFYVIQNVSDNTHFDIVSADLGTATGNWRKPAALVAGADAAGVYELRWGCTFQMASANKQIKFEARNHVAPLDRAVAETKPSAADPRAIGNSGYLDVVAGDRIILTCKNKTDTADITIIHSNIHLKRLY